ncbi:Low molecular weight phosphotyrosine protein phosphatase [Nocardioides terrae]|uniref:Low molecular weight phosphotyrosine protein phosphatase n=1 Tax=Nocardioides terrae TaxID=574651 RepID=A0A1I1F2P0_9ACTN|nr:hypothetical protein [Nocardioides terrae]SFB91423.1 Low molecular weight phosphotyrosine protein phosphatase [Nocardioides terrae]
MIPAPRTPGRHAVAPVCLGNICRSPMADVVLQERPHGAGEVPDPYYGGDDVFEEVLAMVERTADALVRHLAEERRD